MENRKNTERKTVIKNQKNDGCFLTSSLRKPPTSTHTNQNCKNPQTLDTTIFQVTRRSGLVQNVELVDMTAFARV